ncbi:MAG TPA: hypothetical protein DCP91_08330 [Eggerthellaceae bacterium]|nr:hypothetical protein [Eggerthellaceae bacterium]
MQVRAITVQTGRLVCEVAIPEQRHRQTTPRLAAFATGQYPDLPQHACVNDRGPTFGSAMEHTSVAHLLEHVAISIQTRRDDDAQRTFVGTTEWLDEQGGLARVQISFHDDLEALRAFNDATRFVNTAVLTCLS